MTAKAGYVACLSSKGGHRLVYTSQACPGIIGAAKSFGSLNESASNGHFTAKESPVYQRIGAISWLAIILGHHVAAAETTLSGSNEPPKSGNEPSSSNDDVARASSAEPTSDGPPTLLSKKAPKIGAYGGATVLGSRTMGQNVVYVGGELAILLDHRLALGLAGYGLASHIAGASDIYRDPQRLGFGYGGLLLRYSFLSSLPYYVTVGTLLGAGGVAYTPEWHADWSHRSRIEVDPVFVVEPSLGAHLNLTRWMRLGAQISYRIVSVTLQSEDSGMPRATDLAGIAYGGHLQFGWL